MGIEHLLLWCGVIAGPLFIVIFLIEGALRPGYQPLRQPVSALAIGPRGWIQRVNFYLTGALAITYATGLPAALEIYDGSFWAPLLVGIFGAGLIGAGIFVTDVTGLPKEKDVVIARTKAGIFHDLFSLPVFVAIFILGCFVFARLFATAGESGWQMYSIASAIVFLIGFVLAGKGFSGSPRLAPIGGLLQRITIIVGWMWLSLVAAHLVGLLH